MNLLPQPRVLRLGAGEVSFRPDLEPRVSIDPSLHPQGYRLTIDGDGVGIGSDAFLLHDPFHARD